METPKVLFEDDNILILEKPAGWVVNDAKTAHGNPIVQNWLKENMNYELSGSLEKRSGIVHRLDKETSGLLIVAKTDIAFDELQKSFKDRLVKKEYQALVHGVPKMTKGTISEAVGRLPWNRERFGVLPGGKPAETGYNVEETYSDDKENKYSFLSLYPKTGRTHQIRIHLKHIGNPIVADSFYAGRKTSKKDRLWCKRLFLHAGKINFLHPTSKKQLSFSSNLPDDLKMSLKYLRKIENV